MLDRDAASYLIDDILRQSDADETEVALQGGRWTRARFEVGRVRVEEGQCLRARIRTLYDINGPRQSVVTTDLLSIADVDAAFVQARALATAAEREPAWRGMIQPWDVEMTEFSAPTPDSPTVSSGPVYHADAVSDVVMQCQRTGLYATVEYGTIVGGLSRKLTPRTFALGNSNGWSRHHLPTDVWYDAVVESADGGLGTSFAAGVRRTDFDPLTTGRRAFDAAVVPDDTSPVALDSALVLFEPHAVESVLACILPLFSATAVAERRSPLRTRNGQQVGSPLLTMRADPSHRLLNAVPFDGEGVPSLPLALIDAGIHRELAVGRDAAEQRSTFPNGYGAEPPSDADEVPRGIIVDSGVGDADTLIAAQQIGVIRVPRVHPPRLVSVDTLELEVVSSHGAFRQSPDGSRVAVGDVVVRMTVWEFLLQVVALGESRRVDAMGVPSWLAYGLPVEGL